MSAQLQFAIAGWSSIHLEVKCLDAAATLPKYASEGASGMDLYALEGGTIGPGSRALVRTGIAIAVPPGYELQIRPRSGLARHAGITVLNSPGTIDSDYRGEIGVILMNHDSVGFSYSSGDRIAQAVLTPVYKAVLNEVKELSSTVRGSGGFGSTG